MNRHVLRFRAVDENTFNHIKSGSKKVETRAATTRYENIKKGDILVLVCGKEKLEKKIKNATTFKSIDSMLRKYKVGDIMPDLKTKTELEKAYYGYPGYREKIRKFGLIALEL